MYISCEIDHMRIINIPFNDNYINDIKLFIKLSSSRSFLFLINIVSMQIDLQFLLLYLVICFYIINFRNLNFFSIVNKRKYIEIKKEET